ncbi:MAG: COX15/CtaA family protein [Burkholderiales bacterium]|jgi:cytochrome c oxidase assembly protein subunit 15
MDAPLYDFSPIARLLLMAILMATAPLAWVWLKNKNKPPLHRLRALTLLTLFFTFDLLGFGAFTRLTHSGLGCPDWPGCYGSASPIGARDEIHAAQSVQPHGPVTHSKAWIEMIHRYLAAMVGVLITVLAISNGIQARRGTVLISPWWSYLTLIAVCVQGAFGALTVTLKLYPAIVTLHLLGGIGLLMLLVVQAEAYGRHVLPLTPTLRMAVIGLAILSLIQITLGAWVSTNYAVLACTEFPTCQGEWWPAMDFNQGFSIFRHLGQTADGGFLPLPALTAIHMVHRWAAAIVLGAMLWLAFALWQRRAELGAGWSWALTGLAAWQLLSGLSNVVLGWPLLSALAHTLGAATLMCVLTMLACRAFKGSR